MPEIRKDIIFGDGMVLENSYCVFSDRDLCCFVEGKTILECVQIFSDIEKTAVIKSHYLSRARLYKGFTDLLLVQKTYNGMISVCLTWPEGEPHSVEELEDPEDE